MVAQIASSTDTLSLQGVRKRSPSLLIVRTKIFSGSVILTPQRALLQFPNENLQLFNGRQTSDTNHVLQSSLVDTPSVLPEGAFYLSKF